MRLKETLEKWNGFTALHLIAYRGHEETCKVLLRGLLRAKEAHSRPEIEV